MLHVADPEAAALVLSQVSTGYVRTSSRMMHVAGTSALYDSLKMGASTVNGSFPCLLNSSSSVWPNFTDLRAFFNVELARCHQVY